MGAKEATATEAGYTGDTYCDDCKKTVVQGTIIPSTGGGSEPEKPTPTPGNGDPEKPTPAPGNGDPEKPTPMPGNSDPERPTPIVSGKGKTLTKGANKYIVTTKGKAVSYAGPVKKKASSVTIPATVTIGGIKYKVTSVGGKALQKNTYVKKVIIGKNVASIGTSAFSGCTKLKTVTFKKGSVVKTIKKKAFNGCRSLKNVTIVSKKLKTVEKNAFKGIKSNAKIKVPSSKVKSYIKKFAKAGLGKKVKITK